MQWDIFCRVIDNLGDIGVCWRLCADLASRGQQVRLWIDQPGALAWMAPGALEGHVPGVQVRHWTDPLPQGQADAIPAADVWVEAFGCEPPAECSAALATRLAGGAPPPVWINLEYLSAEPYVERSHRLPSLLMNGPLKGLTRWFFYPGFTPATGGLLHEADTTVRQAAFDAPDWLRSHGLPAGTEPRASLFCYEPDALPALLAQWGQQAGTACDVLVTPGRATQAVATARSAHGKPGPDCRLHALPALTQRGYDELLWACDLNFVRGEDSLVRALWAGRPFVWHIYPQHDNAHHAKLAAFLDWLDAPPSLRAFHQAWNGITPGAHLHWPGWATVRGEWAGCAHTARQRLLRQPDLGSQLLSFVVEKR